MKLKKFNYQKVNSTNDIAIKKIKKGINEGIIVAEEQMKGRGQFGKKWISFKGNLFLSIFFQIRNKILFKKITDLNCSIIKKILTNITNKKIIVKLPNDLLINKKKICGILQEIIMNNDKKFIIIGIGINLIRSPKIKNYPTTNIYKETGKKINKSNLLKHIKLNYEKKFKRFALRG
mgnify:CR=1 FL=1